MKVSETRLPGVKLIEPRVFGDARGFFFEQWHAARYAEQPQSLHELLLYSAVCGTGLDTVPLPGDVSEAELAGAYLDVGALSVALGGKPLTARLFPVPGAAAGSATAYTFEYFHNTRVPSAAGGGAAGILARGG